MTGLWTSHCCFTLEKSHISFIHLLLLSCYFTLLTDTASKNKMANVSHGRGGKLSLSIYCHHLIALPGAANIGPDTNTYVDGEITREGPIGNQGDGSYSAGRGGAGNIDHEAGFSKHGAPHDSDAVPETATRIAKEESHHVGRGGAGNEQHVHHSTKKDGEGKKEGFVEKIKGMFSSKK
jgi:hypothetical protein